MKQEDTNDRNKFTALTLNYKGSQTKTDEQQAEMVGRKKRGEKMKLIWARKKNPIVFVQWRKQNKNSSQCYNRFSQQLMLEYTDYYHKNYRTTVLPFAYRLSLYGFDEVHSFSICENSVLKVVLCDNTEYEWCAKHGFLSKCDYIPRK